MLIMFEIAINDNFTQIFLGFGFYVSIIVPGIKQLKCKIVLFVVYFVHLERLESIKNKKQRNGDKLSFRSFAYLMFNVSPKCVHISSVPSTNPP